MRKKDTNIGLVTFPIEKSGVMPLNNLLAIFLEILGGNIYLISGNRADELDVKNTRIQVQCLHHEIGGSLLSRLKNYIVTQVRITYNMLLIRQNVDSWCFYFGGELLVLPFVIGKLTRKSVLLYLPNSCINDAKAKKSKFSLITRLISKLDCYLANRLIIYSSHLLQNWGLEPYQQKILIAHRHFLNFDTFHETIPFKERFPITIGYIGRLSEEKGVQHLSQALPAILRDRQDLCVLIGGEGKLKEAIITSLQEEELAERVDFPGWIPHNDLPKYLNRVHLLVLPSYSEGLPNIMLEAMACGTAVLATPVGAIPDVIIDGKTGFIMEDNSPECIAKSVIQALSSPSLEQIAENGRRLVEEHFTFERVVERWKEVFEEI